jgi:hypothetical protein
MAARLCAVEALCAWLFRDDAAPFAAPFFAVLLDAAACVAGFFFCEVCVVCARPNDDAASDKPNTTGSAMPHPVPDHFFIFAKYATANCRTPCSYSMTKCAAHWQ